MKIQGILTGLNIDCKKTGEVLYSLTLGQANLSLNEALGSRVSIEFLHQIYCAFCSAKIRKTYSNGSCYRCFISLAQNDLCIVKPETCHFHKGSCRSSVWGEDNCFQEHCVYLSNTSDLKVGITKHFRLQKRWLDQGATEAIPLVLVRNRLQAGLVEVFMKKYIKDKTNWRKMLQGTPKTLNLKKVASGYHDLIKDNFDFTTEVKANPTYFNYPIHEYPSKISSYNLDKTPKIEDMLTGLKGQYLIMKQGVLNLKKFSGYEIIFNLD